MTREILEINDRANMDREIAAFRPISDMKFYRSTKKAAERINPAFESKRAELKKPRHQKQLLIPDTAALIPQKRVKADLKLTSDKFRTVESIMTETYKRSPTSQQATFEDDLILKPVEQYMAEIKAQDILREEKIKQEELRQMKFKSRAEIRRELYGQSDEEIELESVKVPKKKLFMGTSSEELKKRHENLIPDRQTQSRLKMIEKMSEDDGTMINVKSASFKYRF